MNFIFQSVIKDLLDLFFSKSTYENVRYVITKIENFLTLYQTINFILMLFLLVTSLIFIVLFIRKNIQYKKLKLRYKTLKNKPILQPLFGMLWDNDLNPYCSDHKILATHFYSYVDKWSELRCAKCRAEINIYHCVPLYDDNNNRISLDRAKKMVKKKYFS
jgi:hypothetical protein